MRAAQVFRQAAFWGGPLLTVVVGLTADLVPGKPEASVTAGVALWMAWWWMTEAAPMAITALLPVALFPLLGLLSAKQVTSHYINPVIFLYLGGFLFSFAMEKWRLHLRVAYSVMHATGGSRSRILLGFMLAAFLLSMWTSNIATTLALLPAALAAAAHAEEDGKSGLGTALMLGLSYAATFGGTASPVGTAPNLIFFQVYADYFPERPAITFAQWFAIAVPTMLLY